MSNYTPNRGRTTNSFVPRTNKEAAPAAKSAGNKEKPVTVGKLSMKMPEGSDRKFSTLVYLSEFQDSGNSTASIDLQALLGLIESGAIQSTDKYVNLAFFGGTYENPATEVTLRAPKAK